MIYDLYGKLFCSILMSYAVYCNETTSFKSTNFQAILGVLKHRFEKSTHSAIFEDLVNLRTMCLFCYLLVNSAVFTVVFIMQSRGAKVSQYQNLIIISLKYQKV